ncbi:FlgB family protein [Yoonia sp. SS1-5]|uniref:FlgB family protein n=1 Tax=Yoonia rhodophyticola TaxID=3137370 RepID=A0AAN0ME40_9RHOB
MFDSLDIFQTATAMARHAGARQAIVAQNIANADTPGFQAQAIAPFSETYQSTGATQMRTTRSGHVSGSAIGVAQVELAAAGSEPAPNGNTVSLEEELLNSVAISREHDRALAVYRHAMTVLRTTLGRS